MKLITAIVGKEDSKSVTSELIKAGFNVTRLATTGGFLLSGNVTLIIGTEDDKVDACIGVIREFSCRRTAIIPGTAGYETAVTTAFPLEVAVGGATVFVTNVERFEKL